jgi:photoactive yellow protein
MQFVTFASNDTANAFAKLTDAQLDNISFGIIQIDAEGEILMFNDFEAGLTGRQKKAAIGRNFFTDVAICTDVPEFRGRFDAGVRAGTLDIVFEFHLGGKTMPRVQVHMVKATRGERYWICTKRL